MKIKILLLSILFICLVTIPAHAGDKVTGWDFYFFGVNAKTFKEANYWKVSAGIIFSLGVHTGGHWAYAKLNGMDIHQEGFSEIVGPGYEAGRYREFAQAGFLAQNLVGLALTSIPKTRQSDFTKGYVAMAFIETVSHPLFWPGENSDLNMSNRCGGNATWEYVGYTALAIHNLLRVKWYKE
jgi:hypothetical protein